MKIPPIPLAVAACLDSLSGEQCSCETVVARRINSRIYRARCRSRLVAIKECFKPGTLTPDAAAAEREFTALKTLSDIASRTNAEPLAPVPLALCPEHAAYAMTWVSGRPATEIVLAYSIDLGEATLLGEAAGAWLQRFHAAGPLRTCQSDFVSKLKFVSEILEGGGGARDPLLRRAANALIEHSTDASALPMPASWVHGDMKSDNLLVGGRRVTGLDVQLIHENTVAYDLAPFLNHLRLLRWSPRGLWQGKKLNHMAEGFLKAYSPDTARWRLPITWLRAYLLIQVLAPSSSPVSLRALTVRWPARKELASLIDELDEFR